jgi:hypothetical protein
MGNRGFGDGARTNSHGTTFENRAYADPLNATILSKLQSEAILGLSRPGKSYEIESSLSNRKEQVRITNSTSSDQTYTTLLRPLEHRHTKASNYIAQEMLSGFEIVSNRDGHIQVERAEIKAGFNRLNELVDPGTGRLSAFFSSRSGQTRIFQPGFSEPNLDKHFREIRDKSGHIQRKTEPLNDGPNCRVPFSGRSECTYILKDKVMAGNLGVKSDSLALTVTIDEETKRDKDRKILARLLDIDIKVKSLDGLNLATIEQSVTMNQAGIIQSVATKAKRTK